MSQSHEEYAMIRTQSHEEEPITSAIFDASDADVLVLSSDNVIFRLHRKNLEINAGAFPSGEFDTHREVVSLEEPADVLDIVFRFIYPKRHPNLRDIGDLMKLLEIAEAVEKYEIFPGMNLCEARLREQLNTYTSRSILVHALKHDYPDLMEKASIALSRRPIHHVLLSLPPQYVKPWILYHRTWSDIFEKEARMLRAFEYDTMSKNHKTCDFDARSGRIFHLRAECIIFLKAWLAALERLEDVNDLKSAIAEPSFALSGVLQPRYSHCTGNYCKGMPEIKKNLREEIAKNIPPFAFILNPSQFPDAEWTIDNDY